MIHDPARGWRDFLGAGVIYAPVPPSTHAVALVFLTLPGCAQTSQPVSTSAPMVSTSAGGVSTSAGGIGTSAGGIGTSAGRVSESAALDASVRADPVAAAPATAGSSSRPADDEGGGAVATRRESPGVSAEFRGCRADADCIAVERAGCCHNGWKEAVAASQADAYANANPCTKSPRPVCPMFRIRDPRVARCEAQTHLCTMVRL
jgi:hypothetical protein